MNIHKNLKYLLVLILVTLTLALSAQTKRDSMAFYQRANIDTLVKIEVLTEYRENSIFIRWAPTDASSWYNSIHDGYTVYRMEVDTFKNIPLMQTIDSTVIKPWPLDEFKKYKDSGNENILIAAQCLYGTWDENMDFTAKNAELMNRYSFALFSADIDWDAALSLGLAFEDKNIEKGKTYFYRILSNNSKSRLHPGYMSLKASEVPKPFPLILNTIESENSVTVQWSRSAHEEYFSGYYIERSEDGKTFQRLNSKPFVGGVSEEFPSDVFAFTDKVENYIRYKYRIVGLSPFGNLSEPSLPVEAMGRDRTPPGKVKGISVDCDGSAFDVNINWEPVKTEDLKNYAVYRADRIDGNYKIVSYPLLDKTVTEFVDPISDISRYYFYKISAIDTAGNYSMSLPVIAAFRDTVSPEAPLGLTGEIDSLGVVNLRWSKNKEPDLAGYHVYMTNDLSHMFVKLTSNTISDNSWTDTITLKTFTENIYYKIAAIDLHGHFSDFSEIIKLKKPDIIPPFPPSIKSYKYDFNSNKITIHWLPSRSSDLDHHELYKKVNGKWGKLENFDDSQFVFYDNSVEPGKVYKYKIIAVDDDGLISNNKAFVLIKTTDKKLPSVPKIKSCKYIEKGTVKLDWDDVKDEKFKSYTVYRSVNSGPLVVIARVNDRSYFVDKDIQEKNKYYYTLKQSWKDGKRSKMSESGTPIIY